MDDADELYLVWPYVDVHTHVRTSADGTPPGAQSLEKYLARMAQTNIVAAIPSAGAAAGDQPSEGRLQDVRAQNDATAAGCRRYAERFPIGLALFEPGLGQAAADEIERAMIEAGLVGLMCPPPRAGAGVFDAVLHSALEVVDARGGLALLHVGGGGEASRAAAAFARRFRRTTFIMANVSMNAVQHRESIAAFAGLENVWGDFARHPEGADRSWDLADLGRGLSAGRLLFGSDAPYCDYRVLQEVIEAARIDPPRKDRITWGNAVDLINRFRPGWTPPRTPPEPRADLAGVDLWRPHPGKPGRLL